MKTTKSIKSMTNEQIAKAIVDYKIEHSGMDEDDREWLMEREMRDGRDALIWTYEKFAEWESEDEDDSDMAQPDDEIAEPEDEPRRLFDGDLGGLLGDFEWQYDIDAIYDAISEFDYGTYQRFYKRDDEMPDWDEIDAQAQWAPITENVEHLLEWYGTREEPDICDVDEQAIIDALTETDDEGTLVWKPLTNSDVVSVIYDNAMLTSDNMGTYAADDMAEHLDDMWNVIWWADAEGIMISVEDEDEEEMLGRILYALTDGHGRYDMPTWKHITRSEAYDIICNVVKG